MTPFQLKLLEEIVFLFIDGTFKICPKNFAEVINIIGHITDYIRYKLQYSNSTYFNNIKIFFSLYENFVELKWAVIQKVILTDYEQALRKAIKQAFPSAKLSGCFFHYIKSIWNKARKLSLCKKSNIKETSKLIFFFKIYIFY